MLVLHLLLNRGLGLDFSPAAVIHYKSEERSLVIIVCSQLYKRQILYNWGKLFNEKRGFYGLFYV